MTGASLRNAVYAPPCVTCIIIFFNEERFLGEAIESVLAQTYEDWELLLIDDGSTDGSASIGRAYAESYPSRIRYLTHPDHANHGMSTTRNLGLLHAKGRLIAFLDGDDMWLPNKLERQVKLFERFPDASMVCGATEFWYSWDVRNPQARDRIVPTGVNRWGRTVAPQNTLVTPPQLARILYPLSTGSSPSMSGLMMTRELVALIGGFEDEFRGLYEDQAFKIKAYLNAKIYISDECFDLYRQHRDGCVNRAHAAGLYGETRRDFLKWLEIYLEKVNCQDIGVRWRLRRAFVRYRFPRLYTSLKMLKGLARMVVARCR